MAPVSHVNVLAVGDELIVTWRGGSATTSIFVSDDPDDAGVDVRAPDAPGRSVLPRSGERVYIHIFEPDHGFTVAAERRIDFEGPDNFRDLGGYPTMDGAATRWGSVFRSDRLDGLTDADHGLLDRLGVTTVFDLRSDEEVAHAPDRLPAGVTYVRLAMSSDTTRGRSIYQRIVDGDLEKFDHEDMAGGYIRMLDAFSPHLAVIIEAVAVGEPVLFHCTAGKDRTGVAAMVLLGLADVADPHVLDDYEMTNRYRPMDHDGRTSRGAPFVDLVTSKGLDPVDFEALWQAPRPVMRRTVDGLRERWGDHRGYARAIGLDDATIDAARGLVSAGRTEMRARGSDEYEAIVSLIPPDFSNPADSLVEIRTKFDLVHGLDPGEGVVVGRGEHGVWVRPVERPDGRIVLFVHGGGFVTSSAASYAFWGAHVAWRCGIGVLIAEYRLAPETVFPAQLHDVAAAHDALLAAGVEPHRIIVMGDSCGGGMAIAAMLLQRANGRPMPGALVGLGGWYDLEASGVEAPTGDPFVDPDWLRLRGV